MGFCLECGEVTAQKLCFECFSRFDILEADAEFEEYTAYILKEQCEHIKGTNPLSVCIICNPEIMEGLEEE